MAAPYIDVSFKEKFNRDLHLEYTQQGSLFRGTIRTDGQVDGSQVHFEKLGTLIMVSKSRGGTIPVTNPAHNRVTATMADRYIRCVIEQLDTRKLSIEAKAGYVSQMAQAAADETDDTIIEAIDAGVTGYIGDYGSSDTDYIDENMALEIGEWFDSRNVPRDGKRFCAVTPRQWAALMKIESYASADYVGPELPFKKVGFKMRTWNDVNWFMSNRLPGKGTATARCLAYHYSAVGFGVNNEYEINWQWSNDYYGWDGAGAMSMGGVIIDTNGALEIRVDDTGALPA